MRKADRKLSKIGEGIEVANDPNVTLSPIEISLYLEVSAMAKRLLNLSSCGIKPLPSVNVNISGSS